MEKADAVKLEKCFREQNCNKPFEVLEKYYQEQISNKRQVFIAELNGETAGYTTLLPSAPCGPFAGEGLPEITDFNVFIKFQRRGIGNKLLDAAEQEAAKIKSAVSLGVGLHYGYGTAQRMYVKRGKKSKVRMAKKKKFIKGGRMYLYPTGTNIYRCSQGIKKPTPQLMTYSEVKKNIIGDKVPDFARTIVIEGKKTMAGLHELLTELHTSITT